MHRMVGPLLQCVTILSQSQTRGLCELVCVTQVSGSAPQLHMQGGTLWLHLAST